MKRTHAWLIGLAIAASLGGAPATPTYVAIDAAIARVEAEWAKPGTTPHPNAPGWKALFAAVRTDLAAYSAAKTDEDRVRALNRLYQISVALDSVNWAPANEIRNEIRTWLRPRVTLAWAARRLVESVKGLPTSADPNTQGNRDQWVKFVGDDLGAALQDYEGATEVRKRGEALDKVHKFLDALQTRNRDAAWAPSIELQTALNDLYNGPNLQATADVAAVSPKLANYVVESGPVTRKGQTSYVTAGPYLGFGLMASDDGIMFFNRQALSSVTPINGFQQQVASDRKGKRAAKLYQFGATSTDQSVLTIIAVLRPTGIQLFPQSTHNVDASVVATPQPGSGLGRTIACLVGMGERKITQKVYEGAIGEIRTSINRESQEEAEERAAARSAQTSAQLRNVFVSPDTLAVKNFEVDGIKLRSRPEFVIVDGKITWKGATDQVGAEMPKPSKLLTTQPGVAADVHLPSIVTNLVRGNFQGDRVRSVQNLMVVTADVPKGTPAKDAVKVTENADFATYTKAANDARAANNPKVQAIRIKKPSRSPNFSVDRNGLLVAIVHDFSLEVPAPETAAKGGLTGPPARIYRVEAPSAELAFSFQVLPATATSPVRLTGKLESFDPGPGAKVIAINDDETKGVPLTAFTGNLVLNVFSNKLKGQPLDVALADLSIPGFVLSSVSPVDPTGWMRVVLTPAAR